MRIVVGFDGSRSSEVAHEFICAMTWPAQSEFLFLCACDESGRWTEAIPGHEWFRDPATSSPRETLTMLYGMAEPLRRLGHRVEVRAEEGAAAHVLAQAATEFAADLIVVGSRGRGPAASALLGSVSAGLVDHASCPVLVVRQPEASRVLVATDGSASARAIPSILAAWHAFRGLPIEVLSVAPGGGTDTELMITPWASPESDRPHVVDEVTQRHHEFAEDMAQTLESAGWDARPVVRVGDPAGEIVAGARELGCDLIGTGSRGLGDVRRLLAGSVAHDVLLHSHCSVLVMRGHAPAALKRPVAVPLATPASA
jgi:nucleotide-binding universal stress UspA family protein